MVRNIARIAVVAAAFAAAHADLRAQNYQTPPKAIVDILDAAPTPTVLLSPDRSVVALLERRSMPTIADLSEPIHRLAGARINPKTNGRQLRTGAGIGITLKPVAGGAERRISDCRRARTSAVSRSRRTAGISPSRTRNPPVSSYGSRTSLPARPGSCPVRIG
jgi:hypothetical protein